MALRQPDESLQFDKQLLFPLNEKSNNAKMWMFGGRIFPNSPDFWRSHSFLDLCEGAHIAMTNDDDEEDDEHVEDGHGGDDDDGDGEVL